MKAHRIAQLSRLHVRLGLLFAIPLLLIGGTGVLLGFYDALRYGSAPYRLEVPVANPVAPAALAAAVQSAYPGGRLEALYLPTSPERAARAKLTAAGGRQVIAFLDPATGEPFAVRDTSERDLVEWLHDVHRGAIAGIAGELAAAAAAVSLLALWLSGRPLLRQGSRRGHLHGRVGRATGAALALIALTGGVLAFAKPLRERFYPPPSASPGKVATPDPVRIISAGSRAYSGTQLERVLFPIRPGQPAALRFADGARVWVDVDGEVLRTESVLSPWLNLLYPLHSGRVLGKLGPPLMALFGVVLLFLTCSGYLLRSKRHRPR